MLFRRIHYPLVNFIGKAEYVELLTQICYFLQVFLAKHLKLIPTDLWICRLFLSSEVLVPVNYVYVDSNALGLLELQISLVGYKKSNRIASKLTYIYRVEKKQWDMMGKYLKCSRALIVHIGENFFLNMNNWAGNEIYYYYIYTILQ